MLEWSDGNYTILWKGGVCLKRRIFTAALCCLLILLFALPVGAVSSASYIENVTTVTSDGSCRVTLQVTVKLDAVTEDMTFPLPRNAKNVLLNGQSVRATPAGDILEVDISDVCGGYAGECSFRFDYDLPDVVALAEEKDASGRPKLQLTLPLLCGFRYGVDRLEFTINMPGEVTTRPYFTGGILQSTMETIMNTTVKGSLITGTVTKPLVDRETVTMTLDVAPEMFPSVSTFQREGNPEIVPMLIIAGIALLYWLIFLRAFPISHSSRPTAPEGVSAGELGCRLTFAGADLTMLVFHWAQLGYLMIHPDDHGRVILYKRMDMGNERSLFEVKTFKALFGTKRVVDGTGLQYAKLALSLSNQVPGERTMSSPKTGSRRLFRLICCVINAIAGVCLAMNMTGNEFLQVVYAILLCPLGAISAWLIQQGMYPLHLRYKLPLYISLGLSALWMILSAIAGVVLIGILTALAQMLAGLAAAYGGRRSDMGWQNAHAILGFRSYLKHLTQEEAQKLQKRDPEFFFNQIPFALALGVDKKFAKSFGKKRLPPCPYLVTTRQTRLTAESWSLQMRDIAAILDERHRRMARERFAAIRIIR